MVKNTYCVIMAGGVGARFWPQSRKTKPKQFLDILGTGKSFIRSTFERFLPLVPAENFLVVTNRNYKELVLEHLPELKENQVLCEPIGRNTAPCIAYAAYSLLKRDPEANMIVTPSDHLVLNESDFHTIIRECLEFSSREGALMTVGIQPSRPETGYGYIQIDGHEDGDFYKVRTFIEKPELEFAKVFIESGEFYWNSGIFLWNVQTILEAFNEIMPEISQRVQQGEEGFASCPNISIDYGIMEKASNVYVQLCSFGWADLGTWGSLHEASPKDQHRNVIVKGNTLLYDCKDNIIVVPQGKLAVLQGLEDYLVADTNNVLLVCRKDDESTIRRYVNDVQMKLGDEFV